MKFILGDNQFFGINHSDLQKGERTKNKFDSARKIINFIEEGLEVGMDGFMINSNTFGSEVIKTGIFDSSKEIHYSIPYAHKYANMVNEDGILKLLTHVLKNTSLSSNLKNGIGFVKNKNLGNIVPLAIDIEVPKELPKGSVVYLQNILTDLLIGLGRHDLIERFIKTTTDLGYKPGLVTLNPIKMDQILNTYNICLLELVVCFNINSVGFNVFPNKHQVEDFIKSDTIYKKMGMSIFASGASNIQESIKYIRSLELDYVVFGTSRIDNIKSNLQIFTNNA